jgi:hypothetical protein
MPAITQLLQDTLVGEYRVERFLQAGATSTTYRARQSALDRSVALHVSVGLADSPEGERFLARARALAAVEHPHVLSVYDVGTTDDGLAFAATRISDGTSAHELVAGGPLPREATVTAIEQTAGALEALQQAGIAFAPSPQTVLVEGDRRTPLAVVAPLDAPQDQQGSAVAGLGALLATLAGRSDEALLAVARRATDTVELPSPTAVAAAARAAVAAPRRRRRNIALAVAAAATAVAAGLALVLVIGSGGGDTPAKRPSASALPARIAATIPIGEEAAIATVAGRDVWIVTVKNRLVHIDAATNRVVGAAIHYPHSARGINARAGAGSLYITDGDGTVARLDPHTGRVLRRVHVGAVLGAVTVGRDALWLTRSPPEGSRTGQDVLLRLDLHSLRRVGAPVPVGLHPSDIELGPGYADVMNTDGSTVTRVDTRTRRTRVVLIGPKPFDAAVARGRLWIPDPIGGVLTAIDVRLDRPADIVLPVGPSVNAIAANGAVWVVLVQGISPRSPARLIRVDPATGRIAGRALDLRGGVGWPAFGDGALWFPAQSRHAVLRVAPVVPVPATHPAARPAGHELRSGPVTPGRKDTRVTGVDVSLDVRSRGWIVAALPFTADVRRFDNFNVGVSVVVPDQVLGPHGSARAVTSAEQLLGVLRRVPDLRVQRETATTVGGIPARSVMLSVRPGADRPGFCATACVPLYTRGELTVYVAPAMRLTLLGVHGRTVAIAEDTPVPSSLPVTGAIVRSIRLR